MLSKKEIQKIQSLQKHKFRQLYSQYLAEGDKIVRELLATQLPVVHIYALESWILLHEKTLLQKKIAFSNVSEKELQQISSLRTPHQVLAIVPLPANTINIQVPLAPAKYLLLDHIQDPGNLGTIIRSAHWFGVQAIFCSEGSADAFNPKVVQATMGSIFHIPVVYTSLSELIEKQPQFPIYAAVLNGNNIFEADLAAHFFLMIGNESKGIASSLKLDAVQKLTIPQYGTAESLNAAVSCSIILALTHQAHHK